jgi:hypothetical protein
MKAVKHCMKVGSWILTLGTGLVLSAQTAVEPDGAEASIVSVWIPQPLASQDVPRVGTFYLLADYPRMAGRLLAPLPCRPTEAVIYLASEYRTDVFLADCRAEPRVDADLLLTLVTLRIQLSAAGSAETTAAEESLLSAQVAPPVPGQGRAINLDDGGGGLYTMLYGTNDLWMTMEVTNSGPAALASFTIYPPDPYTCWDLIGTTNLTLDTPVNALNATNWAWVLRTAVGETNIVITNLWPDMGFFRLGTMDDEPDQDGLTTALELLVAHSRPDNPDSDGDGAGDLQEFLQGLDPNRWDTDGDGFKDAAFSLQVTQPALYAAIP